MYQVEARQQMDGSRVSCNMVEPEQAGPPVMSKREATMLKNYLMGTLPESHPE